MFVHFNPYILWIPKSPRLHRNRILIWSPEVIKHDDVTYGVGREEATEMHIERDPSGPHKFLKVSASRPGLYRVDNVCEEVDPDCLEIRVSLTNGSDESWDDARAEACVQLVKAPDFRYGDGEGVFYPSVEGIRRFPGELNPPNEYACEFLQDPEIPPEHPLMMVPSLCGGFTLGHAFLGGTMLFGNGAPRIHCIHSYYCRFGDLAPQQTGTATGVVFVVEGGPAEALAYYLEWQGRVEGLSGSA